MRAQQCLDILLILGRTSGYQLKKKEGSDVNSLSGCLPVQEHPEGRGQVTAISVLSSGMKWDPKRWGTWESATFHGWFQSPNKQTSPWSTDNCYFLELGWGPGNSTP